MYSADTTKKAYYHKRVTASEKEILAKHLDRHYGNTNWRKPVKEESEQIDELNKDTLSSYRMAAHRDVNKKVDQKSKGEISNKDYEHGIKKRSKGITKADNKLGTYKNSRIDTSGNADSIRKFGTNEEVESEK